MRHFKKKKTIFKEDLDDSSDATGEDFHQKPRDSQFKLLTRKMRVLQSEVKILKKLSVLSIFGSKRKMKKFFHDIW